MTMKKIVKIDYPYPVAEMGNIITISKENSINGNIEFSAGTGLPSNSFVIQIDKEYRFGIPKVIKEPLVETIKEYRTEYIIFRTKEKINSIIIDIF